MQKKKGKMMHWIGDLFYSGLVLAFGATFINFWVGDRRNWMRIAAMLCGLVATASIAWAGHLASGEIRDIAMEAKTAAAKPDQLAKSVQTHLFGGAL
jgi:hypothetical protein